MSLIKQLWLAIILVMSLAFVASFVITTASSRHYLEHQLETKNTDNAVSLALSISHMKKDPVAINLMLSAQFDNGHYKFIRLLDPNGKLIVEKTNTNKSGNAPEWLSRMIHIEPAMGTALIQDGWSQYGTLTLASSTDFAYQELWEGTLSMIFWSVIIAVICGIVGSLILKMIVRPLDDMVEMTEAIGDKNFITIKEPKTIEFRTLARGMNKLSQRIEAMLKDQSQLLDQMRIEANYDSTTGLMNRKYFNSRVTAYMAGEESFSEGLLVVSHISNLTEINDTLGNAETNKLLKRMGTALQSFCDQYPSLIAGRVTGADFAVFSNEPVDSNVLCGRVKNILSDAAKLDTIFDNFALHTISSKISSTDRLKALDELILTIKNKTAPTEVDILELIDKEDFTKYEDSDETEWRNMLASALEAKRLKLAAFPVMTLSGEIIHEESPARLQLVEGGAWHPAGEFISWATQLGLVSQLDHLVVEAAVKSLVKGAPPIGLNVSTSAMCNPEYVAHIQKLLKRHPEVAGRLWLEIPEHGAFQNLPQFKEFCALIKPLGCKLGVEHVGAQIGRLGELHDLNLDYIKVDASVIRDIDQNPGNKAFLKGICLIAHSIGLIAIAEGVQTGGEMAALPELGIDAMTGPAIKMSAPDIKS
jgi:EAL domain-containing protein (putative c-di-GMP-specific phosphodiesterase class I)/GGDEF domain-containing protein